MGQQTSSARQRAATASSSTGGTSRPLPPSVLPPAGVSKQTLKAPPIRSCASPTLLEIYHGRVPIDRTVRRHSTHGPSSEHMRRVSEFGWWFALFGFVHACVFLTTGQTGSSGGLYPTSLWNSNGGNYRGYSRLKITLCRKSQRGSPTLIRRNQEGVLCSAWF